MQEKELLRELCNEFTANPKCVGIDRIPVPQGYYYDKGRYWGRGGEQYFYSISHRVGDTCPSVNITKEDAEAKTFAEILQEE